jgi:sugar phosphate isomerase/epimerase
MTVTMSRRDFGKGLLATAAIASVPRQLWGASLTSAIGGVKVGIQTTSMNPLTDSPGRDHTDTVIAACLEVGLANIEYYAGFGPPVPNSGIGAQVPAKLTPEYERAREELRKWRLTTPLSYFEDVRKRFDAAGLNLFSYLVTISDDFTDAEIDAVCRHMRAMKVDLFCTNQTRVSMGPRLVPFVEKYNIRAAFHTHAMVEDPNEVATPESLDKLMAMSKKFMVNLDIGHFVAGNNDPVAYIKQHHDRITHLHVKDRKRDGGPSLDWGTGDTPIAECLKLVKANRYPIACFIEKDYRSAGSGIEESKKCFEYMKRVLDS